MIRITLLGIALFFFSSAAARATEPTYSSPTDMLAETESIPFLGRVRVKSAENIWEWSEHGMIPFLEVRCELVEAWRPHPKWPSGEQRVHQNDYTDMISSLIAPPALVGREYLLWASPTEPIDNDEVRIDADWMAKQQGFLLIRKTEPEGKEFVQFDGKFYALSSLRPPVDGKPVPLTEIANPVTRLEVAERRLARKMVGDPAAFVQGLLLCVKDPQGESTRARAAESADKSVLTKMHAARASAYLLWYESISLLAKFGEQEEHAKLVIESLRPYLKEGDDRSRFVVALALASLGDGSGKEALIAGYERDLGDTTKDPVSGVMGPRYFEYEGEEGPAGPGTTACAAYALGRIDDARGLTHDSAPIRLAAADGLTSGKHAMQDGEQALRSAVSQLPAYEEHWTRAHQLLARLGADDSLASLVKPWLEGQGRDDLVATPRFEVESPPPEPLLAEPLGFLGIEAGQSLERLRGLFEKDPLWDTERMHILRASLGDASAKTKPPSAPEKKAIPDIAALLKSTDPKDREAGLRAAGWHRLPEFYDVLLQNAQVAPTLRERATALRALSYYRNRTAPVDKLKELFQVASDPEFKMAVFELASRTKPSEFAAEGIGLIPSLFRAREAKSEEERLFGPSNAKQNAKAIARLLSRLPREGIPAPMRDALKDSDPNVRNILVRAMALSGNPDVIPLIRDLREDQDEKVRKTVQWGLQYLGAVE